MARFRCKNCNTVTDHVVTANGTRAMCEKCRRSRELTRDERPKKRAKR